ncbi:hypothetical protein OKW35_000910 [Paraburkholderia sp. MM5477-R1]
MKAGKLVFRLHGEKLAGTWELVRIAKLEDRQDQWMGHSTSTDCQWRWVSIPAIVNVASIIFSSWPEWSAHSSQSHRTVMPFCFRAYADASLSRDVPNENRTWLCSEGISDRAWH